MTGQFATVGNSLTARAPRHAHTPACLAGALVDAADYNERTPLHLVSSFPTRIAFTASGSRLGLVGRMGGEVGADSCLYPLQACQRDQVDCVLLLLMHGADINSAGESTRTTIEHCQQPGLLVLGQHIGTGPASVSLTGIASRRRRKYPAAHVRCKRA